MSTAAVGTVLDDIRAALVARDGLDGVKVFTGVVTHEDAGLECIAFGDATLNEEPEAMGGARQETWTVDGEIRTIRDGSWAGTIEETIKAARDRSLALFAEVETHINDTYTTELPTAEVKGGNITQDVIDKQRICWLTFQIDIVASKNP